jgi:hypothetical protein
MRPDPERSPLTARCVRPSCGKPATGRPDWLRFGQLCPEHLAEFHGGMIDPDVFRPRVRQETPSLFPKEKGVSR